MTALRMFDVLLCPQSRIGSNLAPEMRPRWAATCAVESRHRQRRRPPGRRFDADDFVLHQPAVRNAEDGLVYASVLPPGIAYEFKRAALHGGAY